MKNRIATVIIKSAYLMVKKYALDPSDPFKGMGGGAAGLPIAAPAAPAFPANRNPPPAAHVANMTGPDPAARVHARAAQRSIERKQRLGAQNWSGTSVRPYRNMYGAPQAQPVAGPRKPQQVIGPAIPDALNNPMAVAGLDQQNMAINNINRLTAGAVGNNTGYNYAPSTVAPTNNVLANSTQANTLFAGPRPVVNSYPALNTLAHPYTDNPPQFQLDA